MRVLGVFLYAVLFTLEVFLGFILLFGCFPEYVVSYTDPMEKGSHITPSELSKKIGSNNVVVYDIRPPEEYMKNHVPGAINADATKLPEIVGNLSDTKGVVIVCTCGVKSKEQAKQLAPHHKDIKFLYGGMAYWNTLDNPVIRPLWQLCS